MTDFNTLSISELTQICGGAGPKAAPKGGGGRRGGGGGDINNYADPGESERPDVNHFLYGSNMPDADREALIRNWIKNNQGNAPAPRNPGTGLA